MLEKLKSDFDTILELVKKAPADLQETAFRMILESWFLSNAPQTQKSQNSEAPPPLAPSTPDAVKPFLTANAVTTQVLGRVFQPVGPGAQLLASDLPGSGKAAKLVNLSLLLCVKQALETGSFNCTLKDLRQMAVHYDCYDSPNFSKTLKGNKSFYSPRDKGADLVLSGPGQKKAAELIKAISAGD